MVGVTASDSARPQLAHFMNTTVARRMVCAAWIATASMQVLAQPEASAELSTVEASSAPGRWHTFRGIALPDSD